MASITVLIKNLTLHVLVVLFFVSLQTEIADAKFVYRYNPMGGELKFLPNSPPYWDDAALERLNKVRW